MRFLSVLFNQIGHLIWWIAKTFGTGVDRRLGAGTGWVVAWALVLLWTLSLTAAVYETRDNILKLAGLRERSAVTITEARVISVETVRRKTLTIEQSVVAEYAGNDGPQRIAGNVTEPVSEEFAPGDAIEIFLSRDGEPSFRNPEDPFIDAALAVAAIGIPLIALFFSVKYLRYRNRLRPRTDPFHAGSVNKNAGAAEPALENNVVMRGRKRVQSYEERRLQESETIRRMHEKANKLRRN